MKRQKSTTLLKGARQKGAEGSEDKTLCLLSPHPILLLEKMGIKVFVFSCLTN